jgi:hypothetical protein
MATNVSHPESPHKRVGSLVHAGNRTPAMITRKCARSTTMSRRKPPIEGSLYFRIASSCVPYNSSLILKTVAKAIHPCSAVTSSATRWTQPPP